MDYIVFRNGERMAEFAHESDAIYVCQALARPGPGTICLTIHDRGAPRKGFVVDSLWKDQDPGTSDVFVDLWEATKFCLTLNEKAGCVLASVRHIEAHEATRIRRVEDDDGESVFRLGAERVFYRD